MDAERIVQRSLCSIPCHLMFIYVLLFAIYILYGRVKIFKYQYFSKQPIFIVTWNQEVRTRDLENSAA